MATTPEAADLAFELPLESAADPDLEAVPEAPGVFLLRFAQGNPYLGRSANLRRRLKRLLQPKKPAARLGNLRAMTRQVAYQPTGSAFESTLLLYDLARRYLPDSYRRYLKLRPTPLIKVHLGNRFPRTYISSRLTRGRALFFGPFLNRVTAEKFENAFLDLFKIRRCREELLPDPSHPGCIYGEMDMCLRPCQAQVSDEQYQAEVGRVLEFLESGGKSLVRQVEQARDQASTQLQFEEAARHHRLLDKVRDALKLKDDLARDLEQLFGVVVQSSVEAEAVDLWVLYKGFFLRKRTFRYAPQGGRPVSLDRRLREELMDLTPATGTNALRSDHLAILRRWYYSSWRAGELVQFDRMDRIPYRRLVNAISRVAASGGNRTR